MSNRAAAVQNSTAAATLTLIIAISSGLLHIRSWVTVARSAAVYPLSALRATVAPPVRATVGLVAVRLCFEADCSRKAKQAKPRPVWYTPCSSPLTPSA